MISVKNEKKLRVHSIYIKFLSIFTITLLLSSVLSGTIMYKLVERYLLGGKLNYIKVTADSISDLVIQYLTSSEYFEEFVPEEHDKGPRFYSLYSLMKLSNQTMGSSAFITDNEGKILFSYPLLPELSNNRIEYSSVFLSDTIINKLNYYDGFHAFSNKKQYETSLETDGYVINQNDFYGLYQDEDEPYLTVTRRLMYIDPENKVESVYGTVSISVPTPEIMEAQSRVIYYFILSTLIAVLIEVIVLSVTTKQITEPIRAMQEAARRLSTGSFERNVVKTTNDEIGELVDSFNSMTVALENLDSVRNDFIANVSHELRTPMTSIGGFIDGILEGVIPPEKQSYYLKIVRSEITRLSELVSELLDMAKMQSGKIEFMFTNFDITSVVRNCIIKLEPIIEKKNLNVEVDFENDPEMVSADRNSIDRVMINLVQNATKFTPEGGIIKVTTRRVKDRVEITVADTGIGISKEEQSLIFDRFYKVDKSRSEDKKGTGLGLSIVKKILIAHKQDIRVESKIGEGSKFIFTLSRPSKEHS